VDARRSTIKGLIFRHFGIYPVGPGQNPARQVVDFLESGLAQEVHGLGAADTAATVGYDFFAGIQLIYAVGQVA